MGELEELMLTGLRYGEASEQLGMCNDDLEGKAKQLLEEGYDVEQIGEYLLVNTLLVLLLLQPTY